MVLDPQPATCAPSCPSLRDAAVTKVRLRFRKTGDLRLVSHHDLMRCFERMLRRAGLPYHSTKGFNPKPRLVFALSLPLGVVGLDEVAELELDADLTPDEVCHRLAEQSPAGLEITRADRIDRRTTAQVRTATYRIALAPERAEGLRPRITTLEAAAECFVERSRPRPRRVNVRPYLHAFRVLPGALEMDLRVTPTGSARAEEVLGLLGLGDLLAEGAVLERARLELEDEISSPVSAAAPGPAPAPDAASGAGAGPGAAAGRDLRQEPA